MGLECHDVGDGGALLLGTKVGTKYSKVPEIAKEPLLAIAASILKPNMVITVEPGM